MKGNINLEYNLIDNMIYNKRWYCIFQNGNTTADEKCVLNVSGNIHKNKELIARYYSTISGDRDLYLIANDSED